jgi:hypothetical protein
MILMIGGEGVLFRHVMKLGSFGHAAASGKLIGRSFDCLVNRLGDRLGIFFLR